MKDTYILPFHLLRSEHVGLVGGKNAAIGELMFHLSPKGIQVPEGFALTVAAFDDFIELNGLRRKLKRLMQQLDQQTFTNLELVSNHCKRAILSSVLPEDVMNELSSAIEIHGFLRDLSPVAVRSSATSEDSPDASFAGQHDSFLFIETKDDFLHAIKACYASLYNARAIKYRIDRGFDHESVRISVGVQRMVDTDHGGAGVCFSLDPDSGFRKVVDINASWGLGEILVQGGVNPDEYVVYKEAISAYGYPVIRRTLGEKAKMTVKGRNQTVLVDTPVEQRKQFVLNEEAIQTLTRQVVCIEDHFGIPMDIEWAKNGTDGGLFILQARPETAVHNRNRAEITSYEMLEHGAELASGAAVGRHIRSGKVRIINDVSELSTFLEGEILVSELTHPDWEPIMKKAAAIVTELGGRTSHAAIVARELNLLAVVGISGARQLLKTGDYITIDASDGQQAHLYNGPGKWKTLVEDITQLPINKTKTVLSISNPDKAFESSFFPNDGVGLLRTEFIISSKIGVHPMAACYPEKVKDSTAYQQILQKSENFVSPKASFVSQLKTNFATVAAAFYPKTVIVRFSDFKSNEYSLLLGGKDIEQHEENPMLGLRGISRYFHPSYRDAFAMECEALRFVRNELGFSNVAIMLPFCRTTSDVVRVLDLLKANGLERGKNGLQVWMMVEVPSNAIIAADFAKLVDGFSIGSNDLTQMTLGIDRDGGSWSQRYDASDKAVRKLITLAIHEAHKAGIPIGFCGQAPSDDPYFVQFLVENNIDSISFTSDAILQGIENIHKAETIQKELYEQLIVE